MTCHNCGAQNAEGTRFCINCGAPLSAPPAQPSNYSRAGNGPSQSWSDTSRSQRQAAPVYAAPVVTEDQLPARFRPLSPWAYFGYTLLFSIPLVGFIGLIVFSFNNDNVSRRNFARSYFIVLILAVIILVLLALVGVLGGLWVRYR